MTEPRVVVAGTLPAAGLELLRARFAVELAGEVADLGSLRTMLPGAAAIVVRPGIIVDGELLDCAGDSLRVVSSFGVGYDHIDLEAARVRGVRVTNTPGVLTDATAELAVALMLAAARRLAEGDRMVRRGEWRGGDPNAFLGRSLVGATVGLIGFGRIGQRVAQLLRGFDVRVLYFDSAVPPAHGAEQCSLDDLLTRADVVSLHVALTPETTHLIDADALGKMKADAILVNASRGARRRHRGADRRAPRRSDRGSRARCLRGRAGCPGSVARAPQHRAAAAHRLGHRRHARRDGAPVRRERDRRDRWAQPPAAVV